MSRKHPPLTSANVFLSHGCADHEIYGRLAEELDNRFDTWGSCTAGKFKGRLAPGDPKFPVPQIASCDVFVFMASNSSLRPNSTARAELECAREHKLRRDLAIVVVAVDGCDPGPEFASRRYLSVSRRSLVKGSRKLVAALESLLIQRAKLSYRRDIPPGFRWISDAEVAQFVTILTERRPDGAYLLESILAPRLMNALIGNLEIRNSIERGNAIDTLADLCLDSNRPTNVRALSSYILGRVGMETPDATGILTRIVRASSCGDAFLLRCRALSTALLGNDMRLCDLVETMFQQDNREAKLLARSDQRFLLSYYGDEHSALSRLREMIAEDSPPGMVPLNVYNLTRISRSPRDLELLHDRRSDIIQRVPSQLFDSMLSKLEQRAC